MMEGGFMRRVRRTLRWKREQQALAVMSPRIPVGTPIRSCGLPTHSLQSRFSTVAPKRTLLRSELRLRHLRVWPVALCGSPHSRWRSRFDGCSPSISACESVPSFPRAWAAGRRGAFEAPDVSVHPFVSAIPDQSVHRDDRGPDRHSCRRVTRVTH
jgi:hypothetical protein